MTYPRRDQYPQVPQGRDAGRFLDGTVSPEISFGHQTMVEYRGEGAFPETTLLFDKHGDGFILGITSRHKYGGFHSTYMIRTDTATYFADGETFVRVTQDEDGKNEEIRPYEASTLGEGISGRIGGPVHLPGSEGPETVTSVELRYKHGIPGQKVEDKASPFVAGEKVLVTARAMIEARQRKIGKTAHNHQ